MRARNREINIFNMSLLDILTGMLGAFLFLMIGLVPYYAKVMSSQLISAADRQKFEELKKLLDKGLKGPLSPEEAEQLKNELNRLQGQVAGLQDANQKLQAQLTEAKQQVEQVTSEKDFWAAQDPEISIVTFWDSDAADIDIFVIGPKGTVFGAKTGKLLGRTVFAAGVDSHGKDYHSNTEELIILLSQEGAGDYLLCYRVPKDATPAAYASLLGGFAYRETIGKDSTNANGGSLGGPNAARAKPGGVYAWATLSYDAANHHVLAKSVTGKLPEGISLPQ